MKPPKTYLKLLAGVALAAMTGFIGTASATQTINVNFGTVAGDAMNGKSFIYNNYQQAPAAYTGTNWNDYIAATTPITVASLVDSDGTATAVGYTTIPTSTTLGLIGPLTWGGQPDVKMRNSGIYRAFNSGSGNAMHNRFTVTGLDPGKTYHIYVASSREVNVKCSWGIGDSVNAPVTFQYITNTTPTRVGQTWAPGDNWLVFYSVAPDAGGNIYVWGQGLAAGDGGAYQGITLNGFQVVDATGWQSSDKSIYNFGLPIAGTSSVISDNNTGTNITWTVLFSSVLTSLAPTFTLADFATASPASGTTRDFSSPVNYTNTAQDGSTKIYRVTAVNAPASPAKDILALTQGAYSSVIAGTNVSLYVAAGTVVTALNPTVTVSAFATVSPLSGATSDFTTPVNYTVTAENGTTKTYAVTVLQANLWTNSAGGLWTTATDWNPNAVPTSAPTTVLGFNTAGTYNSTHDLAAGFQLNRLLLGAPILTLDGNSLQFAGTTPQVVQASASAVAIVADLDLSVDTTITGGGSGILTLSGAISGSGRLTKAASGTLKLKPLTANTYNGGTTIEGGTILPSTIGCFGPNTVTLAGGTLFTQQDFEGNGPAGVYPNEFFLSGGPVTFNVAFGGAKDIWTATTISGPGGIVMIGSGRGQGLTLQGTNTFAGGVTLGLPNSSDTVNIQLFNVDSLGTGVLRTELVGTDLNGGHVRIQGDLSAGVANPINLVTDARLIVNTRPDGNSPTGNPVLFTGTITNGGRLIKRGDGTMGISGANTYSGTTTVNGGILQVVNPGSLGTNTLIISLLNPGNAPATMAVVQLDYPGIKTIGGLTIDAVVQPDGSYGSSISGGVCTVDDVHFAGPGRVRVGPTPPTPATPVLPLSGFTLPGGTPTFVVPTVLGVHYNLLYKNTLDDAFWTQVGTTCIIGTGSDMTLTDPGAVGEAQRFYRLAAH